MDPRLRERLEAWHEQINLLEQTELTCLRLEASEKPLWNKLFLSADGKTVAEREARAFVHEVWINFQAGLVEAKVAYNKEKRILELKQSAFQSAYLTSKNESEAILRMPRAMT